MIIITASLHHPVTVVAADKRKYYFARLIGYSAGMLQVELRQELGNESTLYVTSVIVETFAQLSGRRVGTITIEISCSNATVEADRDLKLRLDDSRSLDFQVAPLTPRF